MNYNNFLQRTLGKAAKIAIESFDNVSESTKIDDNNQVVTQADIEIGKFIVNQIKKDYPTYNIIDEEAGAIDNKSRLTWVVDPIDGTSNFAIGLPTYCIMIGLLDGDIPISGGVIVPASNEIFLAEKGKGAFCNRKRIHVTKETNLLKMLVSYGIDGHQKNPDFTKKECKTLANIILNIRNLRANNSNYDAILVAKGKYGAWLNQTMKIWDNVAPQVIIEEAGGLFTDFFGKKIDYSNPINKVKDNFTVCAAAPILHKKLQKIIHQE